MPEITIIRAADRGRSIDAAELVIGVAGKDAGRRRTCSFIEDEDAASAVEGRRDRPAILATGH